METRRWVNPTQPQTLYISTLLLYMNAVFALLFLGGSRLFIAFGAFVAIIVIGAQVAGAYGIANEFRWGYLLSVAVAGLGLVPFAMLLAFDGIGAIFNVSLLIQMVFPVVLFVLLVHPQSREYQRVWFN